MGNPMLPLFTSASSESVQGGQAVFYICISIGLTLLAGLMSGLTLGLMSMDHVDLEVCSHLLLLLPAVLVSWRRQCRADAHSVQVLMRSGTEKEKKHAERIAPVRWKCI